MVQLILNQFNGSPLSLEFKVLGLRVAYLQHFADVAGTEDLVDDGELLGVIRREVRSEDAVLGATAS